MKYYAGIDIGSTSIKVAIIDDDLNMVAHKTSPTGTHFHANAANALAEALVLGNVEKQDLVNTTATGYGRKLFKDADESITEISANARGASILSGEGRTINTILNIGGQDAKVIVLDEDGNVKNFVMNDKCAAGTGRFLEVCARNLEIDVGELGEYHMKSTGVPLSLNSTCTVFAESEIISLLAKGNSKEDIIAGIHFSIAKRVSRLARRGGSTGTVLFDGGPALNKGLVQALEVELMQEVIVPEIPQITTAYGAGIIARESILEEARS